MKLLGLVLRAMCSLPKVEHLGTCRAREKNPLILSNGCPCQRRRDDRERLRAVMLGDVNVEVGAVAKAPGVMLSPFKPRAVNGSEFVRRGEPQTGQHDRAGVLPNPPVGQGTRKRPCNASQRGELGSREAYQPS